MHLIIDVVDMKGLIMQKVFKGVASANLTHVHQIQTGNMANGIYLIRVISQGKMSATKLVVMN